LEIAATCLPLTRQKSADRPTDANGKPVRSKKATRPQLLVRSQLDGRTNAAKDFDQIVVAIENDLGGHERLSTITRSLVEAFAGARVTLNHLNTSFALGVPVDLAEYSQVVSAMVKIASRLGLQRLAKDITELSLDAYTVRADSAGPVDSSDGADGIRQPATKTRTSNRRRGKAKPRQAAPAVEPLIDDNEPGEEPA
jgi:hypothetical protein